jgi:hypothetical protein
VGARRASVCVDTATVTKSSPEHPCIRRNIRASRLEQVSFAEGAMSGTPYDLQPGRLGRARIFRPGPREMDTTLGTWL